MSWLKTKLMQCLTHCWRRVSVMKGMLTIGEDARAGGFLNMGSSREKVWYWSSVSRVTIPLSNEEQEESLWYRMSTAWSTGGGKISRSFRNEITSLLCKNKMLIKTVRVTKNKGPYACHWMQEYANTKLPDSPASQKLKTSSSINRGSDTQDMMSTLYISSYMHH